MLSETTLIIKEPIEGTRIGVDIIFISATCIHCILYKRLRES